MRAAVCGFCSFPFFVSAQHDNELSRTKLAAFIIHEAESLFSFFYRVFRFFDLLRLLVERESRNSIALFDMLFAAAHSQNFILQSLMSLFKRKFRLRDRVKKLRSIMLPAQTRLGEKKNQHIFTKVIPVPKNISIPVVTMAPIQYEILINPNFSFSKHCWSQF